MSLTHDGNHGLRGQKLMPEWVQRYGRRLTTQRKSGRRQDNGTGDDLQVSIRPIYFARWPVNGIGGGQHGIVSEPRFELRHFELSTCSAWGTWCTCIYLVHKLIVHYLCLVLIKKNFCCCFCCFCRGPPNNGSTPFSYRGSQITSEHAQWGSPNK